MDKVDVKYGHASTIYVVGILVSTNNNNSEYIYHMYGEKDKNSYSIYSP